MKILQVNKFFFEEYGTEKYFFSLLDLLKSRGHKIAHFSTKDPRNRTSAQAEYFVNKSDLSRAHVSFGALRDVGRMIYNREARKKFAQLLDKEKPDLIHIHSIHHQISPSILKEARKRGLKVVQTLHDYKLVTPGYFFPWRDGGVCEKCRNGHPVHTIRHRAHKNSFLATLAVVVESFWHRLTRAYTDYVDHFIVPSRDMLDRLVRLGLPADKISVVPHFLPTNFSDQLNSNNYLGNNILFAGRLAFERGLDHLLYFAKRLPEQTFLVAGDGPEKETLTAQIKMLGFKNVRLLGRLTTTQLKETYRRARLVIFPTKTLETFGLTVLEAQASGKAVVATNLGGVNDLISPDQNGFLYPAAKPDLGLKIIRELLANDELSIQIGRQAQRDAAQYSPAKHYRDLNLIYQKVLSSAAHKQAALTPADQKTRPTPEAQKTLGAKPAYNIAIMGHRGIPGNYGGFETFAEELAKRLVKRGNKVTVYCRTDKNKPRPASYKGIKLVHLRTIKNKYLDTLAHTLIAVWHAVFVKRPDVIIMVNVGNTVLSFIPRLFGIPVILNVDGLEWERKKWPAPAKAYLRVSASLTRFFPTAVVTDAKVIADYYQDRLGINTRMIPYGASVRRADHPKVLAKYALKKDDYFLYVARFEPENNAHLVVKAFEQARTTKKLVMVGDAPYASRYCRQVRATKDPRIIFLGFVYGADYKALQQNAYAYVQATEVGGTHPALIEALGFGNCVLVNGTPENMETANGSAIPFWFFKGQKATYGLTKKIEMVDGDTKLVHKHRSLAQQHIAKNYRWQTVAAQYVSLIDQLKHQPKMARRAKAIGVVQS